MYALIDLRRTDVAKEIHDCCGCGCIAVLD